MAGTGYFIRCNQAFPRTLFSTERQTPHTPSIAVMHENELRLLAISGHASCLGATGGLAGLKGVDLLAILIETHAGRGSAVTAALAGADTWWCVSECVLRAASGARAVSLRTYRTILPWMAQETQYWSLRYILGTEYSAKTEASEMSPVRVDRQSIVPFMSTPFVSSISFSAACA